MLVQTTDMNETLTSSCFDAGLYYYLTKNNILVLLAYSGSVSATDLSQNCVLTI